MFFRKRSTKNVAKIYECPESGEKFGLIAINGDMKNKLIDKFNETFSIQGDHISRGGKASDLCIPTLLASGGGALGISAAASGTLFIATANPATLMAIGNGVGSAVMGTTGIIAQAPFVPLAGALMPVAAPLLAFQVLSTVMVLQKFEKINEKLIKIEKTINRVLQRNEATFIGEIISVSSRIEMLEDEFNISNKFTNDMIIRLALIEDKVNPIFERYKYLYEAQDINERLSAEDLGFKQTDAYMAITLSMLDLKIDILKLKLLIQENPGFIKKYSSKLLTKVEKYQKLWNDIENSPKKVEEVSQSLRETISDMNLWQVLMPSWLGGKSKEIRELKIQEDGLSSLNSHESVADLTNSAKIASQIGETLTKNIEPVTLLYWEDQYGKHSYYTNDVLIR